MNNFYNIFYIIINNYGQLRDLDKCIWQFGRIGECHFSFGLELTIKNLLLMFRSWVIFVCATHWDSGCGTTFKIFDRNQLITFARYTTLSRSDRCFKICLWMVLWSFCGTFVRENYFLGVQLYCIDKVVTNWHFFFNEALFISWTSQIMPSVSTLFIKTYFKILLKN